MEDSGSGTIRERWGDERRKKEVHSSDTGSFHLPAVSDRSDSEKRNLLSSLCRKRNLSRVSEPGFL